MPIAYLQSFRNYMAQNEIICFLISIGYGVVIVIVGVLI